MFLFVLAFSRGLEEHSEDGGETPPDFKMWEVGIALKDPESSGADFSLKNTKSFSNSSPSTHIPVLPAADFSFQINPKICLTIKKGIDTVLGRMLSQHHLALPCTNQGGRRCQSSGSC